MCDCQLYFSNDDKCHKRGVTIKPKFTKQLYTNKEGCYKFNLCKIGITTRSPSMVIKLFLFGAI